MKPKKQVASKALCQELWDMGVRLDTYFAHFESRVVTNAFCVECASNVRPLDNLAYIAPAPTIAELGEVLPGSRNAFDLVIKNMIYVWRVEYRYTTIQGQNKWLLPEQWIDSETLADAMARMIIELIKNDHLTVEQVNESQG
jgi:hypothetical protein